MCCAACGKAVNISSLTIIYTCSRCTGSCCNPIDLQQNAGPNVPGDFYLEITCLGRWRGTTPEIAPLRCATMAGWECWRNFGHYLEFREGYLNCQLWPQQGFWQSGPEQAWPCLLNHSRSLFVSPSLGFKDLLRLTRWPRRKTHKPIAKAYNHHVLAICMSNPKTTDWGLRQLTWGEVAKASGFNY